METQHPPSGPLLIVDDDLSICEVLQLTLETLGFEVMTAHNGADALALIKSSPRPCAILLDMMMPVMDGETFLRIRREDSSISGIPVIVITAFSNVKLEGADAILRKPVQLDDLLREIARVCKKNQEAREKYENESQS